MPAAPTDTPESPSPSTPARVLLIGAAGMLGRAWADLLNARAIPCTPLDLPGFDLREEDAIRSALGPGEFTHAVNCAAWTDVDGAESDEPGARQLNAIAPGLLARACADARVRLTHYSTDYVFPGTGNRPYRPSDLTAPINAYGRTKLKGEHAVLAASPDHLLVRTSWLYAPWGKNFVRTMLGLVTTRDEVSVVDDQTGTPTSAAHLAATSLALLERSVTGTHHITDGGSCTWHAFATEIARLAGASCDVRPCPTDAFPRPAARPGYSVLDVTETEALLAPMPGWRANLAPVVEQLIRDS